MTHATSYTDLMRIILHTPEQLIIEDTPWSVIAGSVALFSVSIGLGLTLLRDGRVGGLLFLATAAISVLYLATVLHRTRVILDRSTRTLVLQRKSFMRHLEETRPLHVITGAELQTDGSKTRPALNLGGALHPIRAGYAQTYTHQTIVQSINAWLDSTKTRA